MESFPIFSKPWKSLLSKKSRPTLNGQLPYTIYSSRTKESLRETHFEPIAEFFDRYDIISSD